MNGTESQSHPLITNFPEGSRAQSPRDKRRRLSSQPAGVAGAPQFLQSHLCVSRSGVQGVRGGTNGNKPEPIEGQAERWSPNISSRLPGRLIEVSFPPPYPVPSQLAQSGEAPSSGPTQGSSPEYSAQPQVGARRAPTRSPPARTLLKRISLVYGHALFTCTAQRLRPPHAPLLGRSRSRRRISSAWASA